MSPPSVAETGGVPVRHGGEPRWGWWRPNAIGAIKVSVTSMGGLAGTQTDQLDDLNLNMTSAALPAAWSILINMRDHGGRLTGRSTWPLVPNSILLNKSSTFIPPPPPLVLSTVSTCTLWLHTHGDRTKNAFTDFFLQWSNLFLLGIITFFCCKKPCNHSQTHPVARFLACSLSKCVMTNRTKQQ